jgi:hypothetical protein
MSMLLLTLLFLVVCHTTALDCSGIDMVFIDVQDCAYRMIDGDFPLIPQLAEGEDNLTMSFTSLTFPPGITVIQWYAVVNDSSIDISTCNSTINVALDTSFEPCGPDGGICSDVYPYTCTGCPEGTAGEYCCYLYNSTHMCGNHGFCAPGGQCSCWDGYDGRWCCPVSSNSATPCSSHGCCNVIGGCTCNSLYSGIDCSIPFIEPDPYQSPLSGPIIATIVAVSAAVAAIAAFAIASACASPSGLANSFPKNGLYGRI